MKHKKLDKVERQLNVLTLMSQRICEGQRAILEILHSELEAKNWSDKKDLDDWKNAKEASEALEENQ